MNTKDMDASDEAVMAAGLERDAWRDIEARYPAYNRERERAISAESGPELARHICAGGWMQAKGYFDWSDWRDAAEYALDSDDWSEFNSMLATEDAYIAYFEWADKFPGPDGNLPPLEFKEWREREKV